MVCARRGLCLCSQTCVLIIHNNFGNRENFERWGNETDVSNLKAEFLPRRNCRVAEMADWDSTKILKTLSQEDLLVNLFYPNGDYDSSCKPEVFTVFVLSHGESGDVILTDNLIVGEENGGNSQKFDSFTTENMFNALSKPSLLKNCLKLIIFGPCRGKIMEKKANLPDKIDAGIVAPTILTSKPNLEDLVIFYSSVPNATSQRDYKMGTWMVNAVCEGLKEIREPIPLMTFMVKVQDKICTRPLKHSKDMGQTSQLHCFGHKPFHFCAGTRETSPNSRHMAMLRHEESHLSMEASDCVNPIRQLLIEPTTTKERIDHEVIYVEDSPSCNYKWPLGTSRGKALIFRDDKHFTLSNDMADALTLLGYESLIYKIDDIESTIGKRLLKYGFLFQGSVVLCVLAKLEETDQGLVTKVNGKFLPLASAIDAFNAEKCLHLVGKLKLFFFLDQGNEADFYRDTLRTERIKDWEKKQFFNLSAGVVSVVGVSNSIEGGFPNKCVQALCSLAEDSSLNFQSTFAEIISSSTNPVSSCIKPQMVSTLPKLLYFPKNASYWCYRISRYTYIFCKWMILRNLTKMGIYYCTYIVIGIPLLVIALSFT